MHSQSPLYVGAFVTCCIRNVEYFKALWRIVHRSILLHSWLGACTRIIVYVESGAFFYSCISMHLHVLHLQMHFVDTMHSEAYTLTYICTHKCYIGTWSQPVRSPSGPCCMLPCEFSLESARLLLCMYVWSTSPAHVCAFSRILMHFYEFVCICMHLEAVMKQVWCYHRATHGTSKSGNGPPSRTGIRIYAHKCILVGMHPNATHLHALKYICMHHVENACIR